MAFLIPLIGKALLGGLLGFGAEQGLSAISKGVTGNGLIVEGGSVRAPRGIKKYGKKHINELVNAVIEKQVAKVEATGCVKIPRKVVCAYKKDVRNRFYDGKPIQIKPDGNFQ